MLSANIIILLIIAHFTKSLVISKILNNNKSVIWLSGAILFLMSLGTAFTGYVVVSGNMSFWAALIILNLATVIPILGNEIVNWLLSDSTVNNWSIKRFTIIHFLFGVISFIISLLHIIVIHKKSPIKNVIYINDSSESLLFVLKKDLILILIIISIIFIDYLKLLIHSDNWQSYSRINTPSHIEPEIYFLWTFSIIKLHNTKLGGVLLIKNQIEFLFVV